MDKYQGKIVGFGRVNKNEVGEYHVNVLELDAKEYLRTQEKASVVVCFKKIDFDDLTALLERGDVVVLDASPRLTDLQAEAVFEKRETFSRCYYPEAVLYTRLYEELTQYCRDGEYGKLLSATMSMRFDGLHDMDLRRKINSDLCVLFGMFGWNLQKTKAIGARRAVPSGEAKLIFANGSRAEYEYQRGDENQSVWSFIFEKAEIKVFPSTGRTVVVPNDGESKSKKLSVTPPSGFVERETRRLVKGEGTNMLPLSDFAVIRKVSLKLR